MKIKVIVPSVTKRFEAMALDQYSRNLLPGTQISVNILDKGPASIESKYDEVMAVPDIIRKAVEAERDGMDAVIIDCMADPGVAAAREMVSIPVIGPAETSMHIASLLGHKFSLITVLDSVIPLFYNEATEMGLVSKIASVRAINIPVLELDDVTRLITAIVDQSIKAVIEDGAHVILFGCTGMIGLANEVKDGLIKHGITDVPVIDPGLVAVKVAEVLVNTGLSHSKRTYPVPPDKEIIGY